MSLLNLFKKKSDQHCYIYCPECQNELISSDSFVEEIHGDLQKYRCNKCGRVSFWDFNAPAPLRITCSQCTHYRSSLKIDDITNHCKFLEAGKCSAQTFTHFDTPGCEYCGDGIYFGTNMFGNQGFAIQYPNNLVVQDSDETVMFAKINYCPICGKKMKKY